MNDYEAGIEAAQDVADMMSGYEDGLAVNARTLVEAFLGEQGDLFTIEHATYVNEKPSEGTVRVLAATLVPLKKGT